MIFYDSFFFFWDVIERAREREEIDFANPFTVEALHV